MGSFKLGGMTLKSIFSKPETILYPIEQKPAPEGLKGHITNDIDVCILCGICERTCPAGVLKVSKPDSTWTIDPFGCVQCGSCVRACPKDCLVMEPSYQKPLAQKMFITLTKPAEEEAPAAKEAVADAE